MRSDDNFLPPSTPPTPHDDVIKWTTWAFEDRPAFEMAEFSFERLLRQRRARITSWISSRLATSYTAIL